MITALSSVEGQYLRDILDQPRALEQTLAGLAVSRELTKLSTAVHKKFTRIVLTGMGASFHALHPLNIALTRHGLAPMMIETSELIHYYPRLFDPKTLIVAVSQSGESAEIIRLLQGNRRRASVVGVTNSPASSLAKRSDASVLSHAGSEFSVSCKTYVTSLMALRWLGAILCGENLQTVRRELVATTPAVSSYLQKWEQHVQLLMQSLDQVVNLFLAGRGDSLAAVGTGALIIKESDHFHAEGMSSAAFRHGPFEMVADQTFVLVFAGSGKTQHLNQRLVNDIRERKGRAELVSEDSHFPPCTLPAASNSFRPILEILPVQMTTLALAAAARREPGRFSHCTKVTTTE